MDSAMRSMGIPSISLWNKLQIGNDRIIVHEDNTVMIRVCVTGRNPTMRYLSRTHGVSAAWLYEQFNGVDFSIQYEETTRMAADVLTKAFVEVPRWEAACWLVSVFHPSNLQEVVDLGDRPPPQLGGGEYEG